MFPIVQSLLILITYINTPIILSSHLISDVGDEDRTTRRIGPVMGPGPGADDGLGRAPRQAGPAEDGAGRGGPAWPEIDGGRGKGPRGPKGGDAAGPGPGRFPTLDGLEGPGAVDRGPKGRRGPAEGEEAARPDSGEWAKFRGQGDSVRTKGLMADSLW